MPASTSRTDACQQRRKQATSLRLQRAFRTSVVTKLRPAISATILGTGFGQPDSLQWCVFMDAVVSPARQARSKHRHDLRTLTYVTLDQANGGIVRNLSHEGIGVQAVAALRPNQQVRVRFELRWPRLRVEARGEVDVGDDVRPVRHSVSGPLAADDPPDQ